MDRCVKCIVPADFPGADLNEAGICKGCRDYVASKILGEEELLKSIEKIKGKHPFDCVIPISGGKDSMYILYYAVKKLGLKVIAVNYDSGYQSDVAIQNMLRATSLLNVPFIVNKKLHKLHHEIAKTMMDISQILGSFHRICGNCGVLLRSVAINTAKQFDAPIVLYGESKEESTSSTTRKYLGIKKFIKDLNGKNLIKIIPKFIKFILLSIYERIVMKVPFPYCLNPASLMCVPKKNPTFLYFFDYMEYNYKQQLCAIENHLDWRHPDNSNSRFDCALACFKNHHAYNVCHITLKGLACCNLIRKGDMTREEALETENLEQKTLIKDCRDTTEKYFGGCSKKIIKGMFES